MAQNQFNFINFITKVDWIEWNTVKWIFFCSEYGFSKYKFNLLSVFKRNYFSQFFFWKNTFSIIKLYISFFKKNLLLTIKIFWLIDRHFFLIRKYDYSNGYNSVKPDLFKILFGMIILAYGFKEPKKLFVENLLVVMG